MAPELPAANQFSSERRSRTLADLGSKDQRGSVRTRDGTEAELLRLIDVAHRFGIRVYLDNVMNHNAFDVPGWNAATPIDC